MPPAAIGLEYEALCRPREVDSLANGIAPGRGELAHRVGDATGTKHPQNSLFEPAGRNASAGAALYEKPPHGRCAPGAGCEPAPGDTISRAFPENLRPGECAVLSPGQTRHPLVDV